MLPVRKASPRSALKSNATSGQAQLSARPAGKRRPRGVRSSIASGRAPMPPARSASQIAPLRSPRPGRMKATPMRIQLFNDPAAGSTQRCFFRVAGRRLRAAAPRPLQPYARCIGAWLEHWSVTSPEALFLAERDRDRRLAPAGPIAMPAARWAGWRRRAAGHATAAGKPLVVLSDNSVHHALLLLAAMHVGRPVCTFSSAYLPPDEGLRQGSRHAGCA